MIPNQWYAILDSKEVRSGKPGRGDPDGREAGGLA